jgi:hypothetical protein
LTLRYHELIQTINRPHCVGVREGNAGAKNSIGATGTPERVARLVHEGVAGSVEHGELCGMIMRLGMKGLDQELLESEQRDYADCR